MKPHLIALIVGFVVFAVACTALVFYGVFGGGGQADPGFMSDDAGFTRDEVPLIVNIQSYGAPTVTDSDFDRGRYAISTINERLGFELFRAGSLSSGPGRIGLTFGAPQDLEAGPEATRAITEPGGAAVFLPGLCQASVVNVSSMEVAHMVAMHELLHCVGLSDDPFNSSIMREFQSETPDRVFPARITDSDRALLIDRYRP